MFWANMGRPAMGISGLELIGFRPAGKAAMAGNVTAPHLPVAALNLAITSAGVPFSRADYAPPLTNRSPRGPGDAFGPVSAPVCLGSPRRADPERSRLC